MRTPRDKRQAERSFIEETQRSLSRFHRSAQWCPVYGNSGCKAETNPRFIPVSREDGSRLYLAPRFVMHAEHRDERGEWQIIFDRYYYTLCRDDDLNTEIVAWQWHPETGWRFPHMHVNWTGGPLDDFARMHLPTSHVVFEQLLLFLIRDPRICAVAAESDADEYLEQKVAVVREPGYWSPTWYNLTE